MPCGSSRKAGRPLAADEAGGADPLLRGRLLLDRSWVLTLLGCLLMLPPLGTAFALDAKLLGVPVALAYLFVVWAALIVCTALISRHLPSVANDPPAQDSSEQDMPPR